MRCDQQAETARKAGTEAAIRPPFPAHGSGREGDFCLRERGRTARPGLPIRAGQVRELKALRRTAGTLLAMEKVLLHG